MLVGEALETIMTSIHAIVRKIFQTCLVMVEFYV